MIRRRKMLAMLRSNNSGALNLNFATCAASITTPVDSTVTVPAHLTYCSSGAIEIDSVALGDGIVVVNGAWRLT